MTRFRDRRMSLRAGVVAMLFIGVLTGCGSDSTSPDDDDTVVLLDVTKTLTAGVTCDIGGVDAEFTAQAGTTVTISATGSSNMTPQFTLYAPDFETQLGFSTADGAGKAKLSKALTTSGAHHITLCDVNGIAGSVRVMVTRPK